MPRRNTLQSFARRLPGLRGLLLLTLVLGAAALTTMGRDARADTAPYQTWATLYDGTAHTRDQGRAIVVDAAGNVIVTGESNDGSTAGADFATVKYDGVSGQQLWVARYDGPSHGHDYPVDVAVDSAGNVLVTGRSDSAADGTDYATVKYDGSTGTELWVARTDYEHGNDAASGLRGHS